MARARQGTFDFGEAVFRIEGDESDLVQSLKASETAVNATTPKITSQLSKIKTSTIGAGQAFSVLGAGVSAFGGTASAALGPVLALGAAMSGLAAATLLTIAPLAIIAALVAAIFNVQRLADWTTGLAEAEAVLAEQEARLKAQEEAIKKRVDTLKDEIAIEKGQTTAALLIKNTEERTLAVKLQQLRTAKALNVAETTRAIAIATAQGARNAALVREIAIMRGIRSEAFFIANLAERRLFLERQTVQSIRQQREERRLSRLAEAARVAAGQVTTPQEALTFIRQQAALIREQMGQQKLIEAAAARIFRGEKLDPALIEVFKTQQLQGFGVTPTAAAAPAATPFRGVDPGAFLRVRKSRFAQTGGPTSGKQEVSDPIATQVLKDMDQKLAFIAAMSGSGMGR